MERIHMNYSRDILYRLRSDQSERTIAIDLGISRVTVHKYKVTVEKEGFLETEQELPDLERFVTLLGPVPQPPKSLSTLETYGGVLDSKYFSRYYRNGCDNYHYH